ncbi:MAG: rane protein [Thermoleophilia bacterium]|nr:rane protein [Thermoleophilia bacterium]
MRSIANFARSTSILVLLLTVLVTAPRSAHAGSYWWTGTSAAGEIAGGVNGFSWHAFGGPFSMYASHCDALPGTYSAGARCILRFNVPGGMTAGQPNNGGISEGDYRVASSSFLVRTERPGGAPAYISDAAVHTGQSTFGHGWGGLGGFVDTGLMVTGAVTPQSITNWFHINRFTVLLHDPHVPTLHSVSVPGGAWKGRGCTNMTYGWSDVGSQMWAMSLTRLDDGAHQHSWAASGNGVVSGYPTAAVGHCLAAPGSGTYTYRTSAWDKSGNGASHDFTVAFDVTDPELSAPLVEGSEVTEGQVFGHGVGYRPAFSWSVGDAHSGVASVDLLLDGATVPVALQHGVATFAPEGKLGLGSHVLKLRILDHVGNAVERSTRFTIGDTSAPVLIVDAPGSSGGPEPVMDVRATDDHSGVEPSTWTVRVNGQLLVAPTTTNRLQAEVGYLVDGTHKFLVSVRDQAGNEATTSFNYVVDTGETPQLPADGMTGIFVYQKPTSSEPNATHRFKALMVRNGRPLTGRAELREGETSVGARDLERNGTVDIALVITKVRTELLYVAPTGAGLEAVTFDVACPGCGGGTTLQQEPATTNTPLDSPALAGQPTSANSGACSATNLSACPNGYPRDVVYYIGNTPMWNGIPLGESGAPLDAHAPKYKIRLVQKRRGVVQRSRMLTFRIWANELAIVNTTPTGHRARTTITPRRKWRTMRFVVERSSRLGRRIASARPGTLVRVRMRVVTTDKNENRSFPKYLTFQVRI